MLYVIRTDDGFIVAASRNAGKDSPSVIPIPWAPTSKDGKIADAQVLRRAHQIQTTLREGGADASLVL